jgi:PIN domain nuclease of toxin-antitoxin system
VLLLDTHVWVWLMEGSERLSSGRGATVLPALRGAADRAELRISVISIWEVAMLEARGRLRFSLPCLGWIDKALSVPGLTLLPITPEIAVDSLRLPGDFHGDPADRLIVATSRRMEAPLATADRRIQEYGRQGYLKVFDL